LQVLEGENWRQNKKLTSQRPALMREVLLVLIHLEEIKVRSRGKIRGLGKKRTSQGKRAKKESKGGEGPVNLYRGIRNSRLLLTAKGCGGRMSIPAKKSAIGTTRKTGGEGRGGNKQGVWGALEKGPVLRDKEEGRSVYLNTARKY